MSDRAVEPASIPVSRRRVLQLLGGTLAVAVSSRTIRDVAATPTEAPVEQPPSVAAESVGERRYRGTATTTIDTDRLTDGPERRSVQHDVAVTVAPPTESPGVESNPFEMTVDASAATGSPVGPGQIVTAEVALDPEGRPGEHVRHWAIQAGDDGVFSGVLQNSGSASNVLTSRRALVPGQRNTMMQVTESMTGGTRLAGNVTPEQIAIDVSGNTVNRFAGDALDNTRPFVTKIRAERVYED